MSVNTYEVDKHHSWYERTLQSGWWWADQKYLTCRHVFPSFQHMLDASIYDFNLNVFLVLAGTYIEEDFVKSMHPQVTFKGIWLIWSEESKQDINLVDFAEIGADFAVVGWVIRFAQKIYKGRVSNVISSTKRNILWIDGTTIWNISDTIYKANSSRQKLGIQASLKIQEKASAIIGTNMRISLSKEQILEILEQSRSMPAEDSLQYGAPRIILRINYPEWWNGLENVSPHPRGHLLVQRWKTEYWMKVATDRVSYRKL